MELVPRITTRTVDGRALSMALWPDTKPLSSARRLPRMFPLIDDGGRTVPPAKVLVLGAGVAGLQAIATARVWVQ